MRFTAAALALVVAASGTSCSTAFHPAVLSQNRVVKTQLHMSDVKDKPSTTSKKDERLRMMKSKQFYRKGFKEVRESVEQTMQEQFKSNIVDDLKSNNYVMERDNVKVYLAKVREVAFSVDF
jgi:hypothetical protein